jgi:hypothetical protein
MVQTSDIPIGTERNMTKGFADDWLGWHDARKAARDTAHQNKRLFWTRAGVAVAVIVGIAGVFVALWFKK